MSRLASGRQAKRNGRVRRGAQTRADVQPGGVVRRGRVAAARGAGPPPAARRAPGRGPGRSWSRARRSRAPAAGRRACGRPAAARRRRQPSRPAPAGTARAGRRAAGRPAVCAGVRGGEPVVAQVRVVHADERSRTPADVERGPAVVRSTQPRVGQAVDQLLPSAAAMPRDPRGRSSPQQVARRVLRARREVVVRAEHERHRAAPAAGPARRARPAPLAVRQVVAGVDDQVGLERGRARAPTRARGAATASGAGRTGAAPAAAGCRPAAPAARTGAGCTPGSRPRCRPRRRAPSAGTPAAVRRSAEERPAGGACAVHDASSCHRLGDCRHGRH